LKNIKYKIISLKRTYAPSKRSVASVVEKIAGILVGNMDARDSINTIKANSVKIEQSKNITIKCDTVVVNGKKPSPTIQTSSISGENPPSRPGPTSFRISCTVSGIVKTGVIIVTTIVGIKFFKEILSYFRGWWHPTPNLIETGNPPLATHHDQCLVATEDICISNTIEVCKLEQPFTKAPHLKTFCPIINKTLQTPSITSLLKERYKKLDKIIRFNEETLNIEDSYVNLAIVEEKDQREKEEKEIKEKIQLGIYQNYEDIYKPKTEISLDKLFDSRHGKTPKRLLALGRAGIGKSTLCQNIAYQWSQKKLWKDKFDAIFWIKLRNLSEYECKGKGKGDEKDLALKVIKGECLGDLGGMDVDESIFKDEKVLFLLDGYDEAILLRDDKDKKSFMWKVVEYLIKNSKNLILTSRPYQIKNVNMDETVEILGFTDANIEKYITKMIDVGKQDGFREFLSVNPSIHVQCHIPVLLDILSFLWNNDNLKSGMTMTEIYKESIESLISRSYERQAVNVDTLKKSSPKRQEMEKALGVLEKIAYVAMESRKIIIDSDMIMTCIEEAKMSASEFYQITLGLLKLDMSKAATSLGKKGGYFIHLTFQEYMAARYLCKETSKTDREAFIRKYRYDLPYQVMMSFMAGIEGQKKRGAAFFESLIDQKEKDNDLLGVYENMLMLRCLNESVEKIGVTDGVMEVLVSNIEAIEHILKNPDKFPSVRDLMISVLKSSPNAFSRGGFCKLLCSLLKDKNSDGVKRYATYALGQMGPTAEKAIPDLIVLLKNKNSDMVKSSAAEALGKIGSTAGKAIPVLIALLKDKDSDVFVKKYAAEASLQIGTKDPRAVTALIQLLNDKQSDKYVKRHVASALGKSGTKDPRAVTALIQLLNDKQSDKYVKRHVASALGKSGTKDPRAVTALIQLLTDKDICTRRHRANSRESDTLSDKASHG